MKNKNIKKSMFTFLLAFCLSTAMAQRNFYHRLDIGSSNIYSFVGSNLITGYANYLSHDILFDNSYSYSLYSGTYQGQKIKTKTYDMAGVTMRDLLNDSFAGVKLGYQSDNMGNLNWGIYASCHYKINQFKAHFTDMQDYSHECVQYIKPGIGTLLTLGSIENKIKVQIEMALRYDIPLSYKGVYGNQNKELNKGISSHFAIKLAGYSWISAGLYADINHYDLYKQMKEVGGDSKLKMYNMGITFTITPKRGEDIYD